MTAVDPRALGKIVHTNSSLTLFVLVCTHITSAFAYNVSHGKQSDIAIDSLALCIIISYYQMLGEHHEE